MLSGYVQKFIPPNRLVIAEWNDSAQGKMLGARWGNPTQTITMLGIASTTPSQAFIQFMSALLNIKACHGLITLADALSRTNYPLPIATQNAMRAGYSSELHVVVIYPTENEHDVGPQFFNAEGELSADILLDTTDQVCDRPDEAAGVMPVGLGDLMVGKGKQSDYAPILPASETKLISLNDYVLRNGLQPRDETKDPRPAAKYFYYGAPIPAPDAVASVLRVGSANEGRDPLR